MTTIAQAIANIRYRPWITDIDRLNKIADAARNVLIQPDAVRFELLEQAIMEAEGQCTPETTIRTPEAVK